MRATLSVSPVNNITDDVIREYFEKDGTVVNVTRSSDNTECGTKDAINLNGVLLHSRKSQANPITELTYEDVSIKHSLIHGISVDRSANREIIHVERNSASNDMVIFQREFLMTVMNRMAGRPHVIVRSRRQRHLQINNDLEQLPDQLKHDFWTMVHDLSADIGAPCALSHHFGTWRSAKHFHVHIYMRNETFAEYATKKGRMGAQSRESILERLKDSEKGRIEQARRYKVSGIAAVSAVEFDEKKLAEASWGGFDIELDSDYPWVKFIPKDVKEIPTGDAELLEYRKRTFTVMREFAAAHGFTGYKIWVKLEGDPFEWDKDRPHDRPVYGIIYASVPEYYALRSDGAEWLTRYEKKSHHVLEIM